MRAGLAPSVWESEGDIIRTLRRLSWVYSLVLFRARCSSEAMKTAAGTGVGPNLLPCAAHHPANPPEVGFPGTRAKSSTEPL